MSVKKLNKSVDERGMFEELVKHPEHGQVSVFTINPGQTRGGHYHKKTMEAFVGIEGECNVKFMEVNSDRKGRIILRKGEHIKFEPMVKHWFKNTTDEICKVLVWRPDHFNPKEPDTYES